LPSWASALSCGTPPPPSAEAIVWVPLALFIVGTVICAPFWCFGIYACIARRLIKAGPADDAPGEVKWLLGWWIGGYTLSWSVAVWSAVVYYRSLSTTAPDCFIAAAAARGHPRFVGSRRVRMANGHTLRVNRQLRVLKGFELALLALAPGIHRPLRAVYNRLGPVAARRIRHPLLADLAYVALKPAEWLAYGLLALLIRDPDRLCARLLADTGQ
jgi:hypothetical protein